MNGKPLQFQLPDRLAVNIRMQNQCNLSVFVHGFVSQENIHAKAYDAQRDSVSQRLVIGRVLLMLVQKGLVMRKQHIPLIPQLASVVGGKGALCNLAVMIEAPVDIDRFFHIRQSMQIE